MTFYTAAWNAGVWAWTIATLAIVTAAYLGIGLGRSGAAWGWGALLFLAFLILLLFAPVKMQIEGSTFKVQMVAFSTRYDLGKLQSVGRVSQDDVFGGGAFRTFASGGCFGYYGLFRGGPLKSFTAYVTDGRKLVLLKFPGKAVVVSPSDPDGLVKALSIASHGEKGL